MTADLAKQKYSSPMEWFVFWLIVNCIVGAMIGQRNNDVAGSIMKPVAPQN